MPRLLTCRLGAALLLIGLVGPFAAGPFAAGPFAAGPARAQPTEPSPEKGGTPVYDVPFAAEGNRLRLTVVNQAGRKAERVTVVATAAPAWITLSAPRQAARTLPDGGEATVEFTFDVAREAPVGKAAPLRFVVRSAGGALATKEVRLKVTPPKDLTLEGNWPNPFAGQTSVGYELPQAAEVRLTIYDLLGRQVAVLDAGLQQAGFQEIRWRARGLASGVYLYRLTAAPARGASAGDRLVRRGRMTLVR